jgi:hypothetical protein
MAKSRTPKSMFTALVSARNAGRFGDLIEQNIGGAAWFAGSRLPGPETSLVCAAAKRY